MDGQGSTGKKCSSIGKSLGFVVIAADTIESARAVIQQKKVDVLLLDLPASSKEWHVFFTDEVNARHPEIDVLLTTTPSSSNWLTTYLLDGASEHLPKPLRRSTIAAALDRARRRKLLQVEALRQRSKLTFFKGTDPLVGPSRQMREVHRFISVVSVTHHPALLLGPHGAGKSFTARAIHFKGRQAHRPFLSIDCRSFAPKLLEAQLFGTVSESCVEQGLLSLAESGTLFIEEVAELTPYLQSRLNNAIRSRLFNARVIASSVYDLAALVEKGVFRKDLYQSLSISTLRVPALIDRLEDIPELIGNILTQIELESGIERKFSNDALQALMRYRWPGGVIELANVVLRACRRSTEPVLHLGDLPLTVTGARLSSRPTPRPKPIQKSVEPLSDVKQAAIVDAMLQTDGNRRLAAKLLCIGRSTLYRKLKEYGINIPIRQHDRVVPFRSTDKVVTIQSRASA